MERAFVEIGADEMWELSGIGEAGYHIFWVAVAKGVFWGARYCEGGRFGADYWDIDGSGSVFIFGDNGKVNMSFGVD